jgi:4-aminobutyrate aminotransferase-like enzyme
VSEVRGRGLFIGVEFRHPSKGRAIKGAAARVANLALQEGLLVLPAGERGQVLELSPPLVVTEEQLEWAVPRLVDAIRVGLGEIHVPDLARR